MPLPQVPQDEISSSDDSIDSSSQTSSSTEEELPALKESEIGTYITKCKLYLKFEDSTGPLIYCLLSYQAYSASSIFVSLTFGRSEQMVEEEMMHETKLDSILLSQKVNRVAMEKDGKCCFKAVAYGLKNKILSVNENYLKCQDVLSSLGIANQMSVDDIAPVLRFRVVNEWISNKQEYEPFIPEGKLTEEAELFYNDGHFSSEFGNSLILAISNVLKLPIIVSTTISNFQLLPIFSRDPRNCEEMLLVAFNDFRLGHYDAMDSA